MYLNTFNALYTMLWHDGLQTCFAYTKCTGLENAELQVSVQCIVRVQELNIRILIPATTSQACRRVFLVQRSADA